MERHGRQGGQISVIVAAVDFLQDFFYYTLLWWYHWRMFMARAVFRMRPFMTASLSCAPISEELEHGLGHENHLTM